MSSAIPRVAVVTGGGSGIGQATVRRLSADGWAVVVGDLDIRPVQLSDRVAAMRCDVADETEVAALVAEAGRRFGGIGAMVNNAGFPGAFGRITDIDVADWDRTFAVLVRGVFLGTKHAARMFAAAGHGGAIVNIASTAGLSGGVGPQAYSAAKAAVISLTQTTAVELARHRVRVNAVAPGPVLTPILRDASGETGRAEELLADTQPWPEHGTAEDVAGAVAYLVGPDSGFVTGHTLVVDGGQTAAGALEPNRRLRRALSR